MDLEDIYQRYIAGESLVKIGFDFDKSRKQMKTILRKAGYELRTMEDMKLKIDWETQYQLYSEGKKTTAEISKEFNCAKKTIEVNFNKLGYKLRTPAKAGIFRTNNHTKEVLKGYHRATRHGRIYIMLNGKRVEESHYNWCIANAYPNIPKGFVIHHRNSNKKDNRPENLVLLPMITHGNLHLRINAYNRTHEEVINEKTFKDYCTKKNYNW